MMRVPAGNVPRPLGVSGGRAAAQSLRWRVPGGWSSTGENREEAFHRGVAGASLVLLLISAAPGVQAQAVYGSIAGTVVDSTGGVFPARP